MNATKAVIVTAVEGSLVTVEVAAENIVAAASVRGWTATGIFSRPGCREEMQGAPTFQGLSGPMYGGPGVVRYESAEAFRLLSM